MFLFLPVEHVTLKLTTLTRNSRWIWRRSSRTGMETHQQSLMRVMLAKGIDRGVPVRACLYMMASVFLAGFYLTGFAQAYSFKQLGMEQGLSNATILDLCQDTNGFIWIATEDGLNRFDGERVVEYNVGLPHFGLPASGVRLVETQMDGTLMIKLREWKEDQDLRKLSAQGYWVDPGSGQEPLQVPQKLLMDSRGGSWVATDGQGLWYHPPSLSSPLNFRSHPHDPGSLIHDKINVIFEDKQQNIWLGGEQKGLCWISLNPDPLSAWVCIPGDPASLMGNDVTAIGRDEEGVWLAVKGKGLTRYHPESRLYENHILSDPTLEITGIQADGRGGLWLASRGEGVLYYDLKTKRLTSVYRGENNHPESSIVRHLYHDGTGGLWFCTHDGLIRIGEKDRVISRYGFSETDDPALRGFLYMYCMSSDQQGHLWVGSEAGLLELVADGAEVKLLNRYNGSKGLIRAGYPVFTIHFDRQRRIWTGSFGGGLYCFNPDTGEGRVFDQSSGLSNNTVYQILEDSDGMIWASTNKGLNRIDPVHRKVDACFPGDGLRSNSYYPRSGIALNDSVLLFGGDHGVSVIKTQRFESQANTNPVCITLITLTGGARDSVIHFPKSVEIKYPATAISVEFTQAHYGMLHKPRFEYRLLPHDTIWKESGDNRRLLFAFLKPGKHSLQIRSANQYTGISELAGGTTAVLKIKVLPRFTQRTSVRLLSMIFLFGIAALLVLQRIRQSWRIMGLRNQIASDLHDEVASGIGAIRYMVEKAEKTEYDSVIGKVGEIAQQTGRAMRDIVWFVNPEHDDPDQIIARMRELANSCHSGLQVTFVVKTGGGLSRCHLSVLQQYYLILKEALHNVVKHSGAVQVNIRLEKYNQGIRMIIEDDGRGMQADDSLDGIGIKNMHRRACRAGSILELHNRPEGGLRVEVSTRL